MILHKLALIALVVSQQHSSPWRYVEHMDKMSDRLSVTAQATSENGQILIGCRAPGPHSVMVSVVTSAFLGTSDHDIFYRFDEQKQERLYALDGDNIAWSIDDKQVAKFIGEIGSASFLRLRVVTYRGELIDLEVSTEGASDVIDKVGTACGDKRFQAKL